MTRLALLVAALAGSYGAGFFLREIRGTHASVGHALILVGALLFGASLFLVGQMYHVDAHDPLAFLLWAVAALGTAVVARSAPVATLGLLAAGAWIVHELYIADEEAFSSGVYVPAIAALYGAALFALGSGARRRLSELELAGPMRGIGYVLCVGGAFVFTFRDFVGEFADKAPLEQPRLVLGLLVSLALATLAGAVLLVRDRARPTRVWEALSLAGVAALVLLAVFVPESADVDGTGTGGDPIFYPVVFNLLVAVFALGAVVVGYQNDEVWLVNTGVAFVAIDIVARYFDFFWDMMPRSLVFIGVGALILTLAYVLERQRSRLVERIQQ